MKRRTFICHPFRRDPAVNVERVRRIHKSLKDNCVPLAPQLFASAFIDVIAERDLALAHCLRLVAVADELRAYASRRQGCSSRSPRQSGPVVFIDEAKRDDPQAKLRAVGG